MPRLTDGPPAWAKRLPGALLFVLLLLAGPDMAAQQRRADLSVTVTVAHTAVIRATDNGMVAIHGNALYSVQASYEPNGRKVVTILY